MILVIDTSSAVSALAILDASGSVVEESFLPARSPELVDRMRELASRHQVTRVAVATGPGSFTGLRVGVSFGLGLAMGLRVPIVPLPTLAVQAARSETPVTALSEAGRGRLYFLVPGGPAALGEPREIPTGDELVGYVAPATATALKEAGHVFKSDAELRSYGLAAATILSSAREVAYGSVRLEYMQSFSAPRA